uniref:hypothetical protein n=1 Tax=Gracilariopsis tenuifrons TaxID=31472 RepID=UPI001D116E8D|nr:hypothetical protein LK036_pgp003 [Gracilariopsis tenuifrons]UAD89362.1 hypothetical protein [Gracilariopsis tenuifrons]
MLNLILFFSSLNPFNDLSSRICIKSVPSISMIFPRILSRKRNYQLAVNNGDIPSKMANSTSTPKEDCRQLTNTQYHQDGSKTVSKTLSCSSKEKYDRHGNLITKTDTNKHKFQSAKNDFLSSSSISQKQ